MTARRWDPDRLRNDFEETAKACDAYMRELHMTGKVKDAHYQSLYDLNLAGFCAASHLQYSAALRTREQFLAHLQKMNHLGDTVGGSLAFQRERFEEYWRSHLQTLITEFASRDQ